MAAGRARVRPPRGEEFVIAFSQCGFRRHRGLPDTEAKRQAVNTWIREQSPADAVVDFDAAVRDPADPSRIAPYFDGSDHLHLNLAGYVALGNAVPLELLFDPACS